MSRRRNAQHSRNEMPSHRRDSPVRGEFIMGRNCIEEVLNRAPERLQEVFLAESRDEGASQQGRRRSEIRDHLAKLRIPIREVSRRELDSMVSSDSHQGVVARVSHRIFLELDGVLDPQNFGAILRAAECFNIDAVVWSKNRGAPIGPVVSKVSVGASELVPLCAVSNLHRALEQLKEAGAWISGAMVSPDAKALDAFEFPEKSVIVMGAEGEGIHQLIEKSLDFRVYITMGGKIDSLNVSQATAVMLHEAAKQRRQKESLKVT